MRLFKGAPERKGWYPWFAWYPVVVYRHGEDAPWEIRWLETVMRNDFGTAEFLAREDYNAKR